MYTGAIIKETLNNELLLDYLKIINVEIWKTNDKQIKYWTMIFFESNVVDFPERLSKSIIDDWFADMKNDNIKYIVFKNSIYHYTIGNIDKKNKVLNEMRKRGIPENQFNWEE